MAKFVGLKRYDPEGAIHVNLDLVLEMERQTNHTLIKYVGGLSVAVKEAPSEILFQMRYPDADPMNSPKKAHQ